MNPQTMAPLTTAASRDTIAGSPALPIPDLARVIADDMAARGYRAFEYFDTTKTLRTADGATSPVMRAAFADAVRASALDVASAVADASTGAASGRARHTVKAIETKARGAQSYVRKLTDTIRRLLPAATDDERGLVMVLNPSIEEAATKAAEEREKRAQAARRRRAELASRYDAEAAEVIGKWLPSLAPGRYHVGDVLDAFRTAIAASKKLPADHGARFVGRTTFYELLDELGTVENGGGHRRYLVVSEEVAA